MASWQGVHHIRLPVANVEVTSDWFRSIFGFETLLYEEAEEAPVGAVLRHTSGVLIGLHQVEEPVISALEGFNILGLTAVDLSSWIDELERLGVSHGQVKTGLTGYFIEVPDPSGTVVQLHTEEQPNVEEG